MIATMFPSSAASGESELIGLVLVSHSGRLAEGLREIVTQTVSHAIAVAVAAGTPDGRLGTNPLRIHEAIKEVMSDDGVLVLVDFGSSVLAVDMALEMLSPHEQSLVSISGGPFVEGAIVAAVQAMMGASLGVATEASNSACGTSKLLIQEGGDRTNLADPDRPFGTENCDHEHEDTQPLIDPELLPLQRSGSAAC